MFTGIIEAVGRIKSVELASGGGRLAITCELADNDLKIGDSVAINGVCLTVTNISGNVFHADVGAETLKVTTLKNASAGNYVNVERPLKLGSRLGGHLMQGHVDAIGKVLNIIKLSSGYNVKLEAPAGLSKYIVKKGSIGINGISLTVADCNGGAFSVFLIPHTIETTTFKYLKDGDAVNLEADIIGKYVEKMAAPKGEAVCGSNITEEFLQRNGF